MAATTQLLASYHLLAVSSQSLCSRQPELLWPASTTVNAAQPAMLHTLLLVVFHLIYRTSLFTLDTLSNRLGWAHSVWYHCS